VSKNKATLINVGLVLGAVGIVSWVSFVLYKVASGQGGEHYTTVYLVRFTYWGAFVTLIGMLTAPLLFKLIFLLKDSLFIYRLRKDVEKNKDT
jgi:hypothetical protein